MYKLSNTLSIKSFFLFVFSFFFISTAVCQKARVDNPEPARFQDQIEQFIRFDQKNSWPEKAVLFVGSSSIRLWKTRESFPELPVLNRGFGGAHISDILYYYDHIVKPYNPALIVFYCGDNDIAGGKPVSQVVNDFKIFLKKTKTHFPEAQFIYLPIKPSGSRWNFWPEMKKVNNEIRSLSNNLDHLYYAETAKVLFNQGGQPDDSLFLDDRLHLNDEGYVKWNNVLRSLLSKLIHKD